MPGAITSRVYRVAEMMGRYSPEPVGEVWRLRNRETGELTVPEYREEELAKAGARLSAAFDILDFIEAST